MERIEHSTESEDEFIERMERSNHGFFARLLTPEKRPHLLKLAGFACLALGAFLGQHWPPAFGLGVMAYGGGGLVFGAIALSGPFGDFLEGRAGRVIGFVVTCFGAWAFATGFCPPLRW